MGGGARRRRTLKYHYSGRYLAHLIGWKRGPSAPRSGTNACTHTGSGGLRPLSPPHVGAPSPPPPSGGGGRARVRCGAGGGSRGNHRLPVPATRIQVKDAVRWGVWLGRHIC